jgi:hypothetical protein
MNDVGSTTFSTYSRSPTSSPVIQARSRIGFLPDVDCSCGTNKNTLINDLHLVLGPNKM